MTIPSFASDRNFGTYHVPLDQISLARTVELSSTKISAYKHKPGPRLEFPQ